MIPKPKKRGPKTKTRIRRRTTTGAGRRAAKASGWVDPDSWQAVLAFYRYACALCDADPWDHMDHCRPLSRGGRHDISNVAPLCSRCNHEKGTRTIYPPRRHPFMETA